jgi:hypothetical protein
MIPSIADCSICDTGKPRSRSDLVMPKRRIGRQGLVNLLAVVRKSSAPRKARSYRLMEKPYSGYGTSLAPMNGFPLLRSVDDRAVIGLRWLSIDRIGSLA